MPKPKSKQPSSPRRPQPNDLVWQASFVDGECPTTLLAAGSDVAMSADERDAMLRLVRRHLAGNVEDEDPIPRLEMTAVTFIQRDTPNRNFVRFKGGMLAAFAKSFSGMPVLRNHDTYDTQARAGTIKSSKLEHNDDGSKQMRMRFELVALWAIEAALLGMFDRFSIGWHRTGTLECSIHGGAVMECRCWRGEMVNGKPVEYVLTGADGTEVSSINVPAVVGTSSEGIRQLAGLDLAELADMLETEDHNEQETSMLDPKVLAALGLKAEATVEDAIAAIGGLKATSDQTADKLTIVEGQLATITADIATRTKKERDALVEAKLAALKTAGKLAPGSESEKALRRMAERDVDSFTAQADDMLANGAKVTPAGNEPQGDKPDVARSTVSEALAHRPGLKSMLAKAGISDEEFAKTGGLAKLQSIGG